MAHDPVKITLLVDNEAPEGLEKEHGFAAWIEAGDRRILFDTGQLGALQINAERLGVNLKDADTLVLSHSHYDHTGTLPEFLAVNDRADLYVGSKIVVDRYSCKPGTPVRAIGIPEKSQQALAALPASRLHVLDAPHYLAPGIGVTGPVPRKSSFEDVGGPFFLDADSVEADPIEDDQSMWFETDQGLVILLGCCHAGLVNTIDYIRQVSGKDKVRGVVGGMHLVNADQQRLDKTFEAMSGWKADFLIPCHCTGENAAKQMHGTLGDKTVALGHAGMAIEAGTLAN